MLFLFAGQVSAGTGPDKHALDGTWGRSGESWLGPDKHAFVPGQLPIYSGRRMALPGAQEACQGVFSPRSGCCDRNRGKGASSML